MRGELKWTFYTTGRDDPEALATWGGDSWQYGGGGSWQPGTVDYENNQILIGTGNPNPDYDYCGADCRDVNADGHRPGDNLYTSSTIAPNLAKRCAASRTCWSTSVSELGWPKPSLITAMRIPVTPPASAST